MKPQTIVQNNKRYHVFNDTTVECSGKGCAFCEGDTDISFQMWENSVPFPIPPKGKRYKRPSFQRNRGKTIREICHICREIPCYICRRTKCEQWMKEKQRQGQEKGCVYWDKGLCTGFSCEKGLIKTHWENFCDAKEKNSKSKR